MKAKLARIVLSTIVGVLGLVMVMVFLGSAGPVAARDDAGRSGDALLAVAPSDLLVDASPGEIRADGSSASNITARVYEGGTPVQGAFVAFTTTLGTIDQYCYVEAEDDSVIKSSGWYTESFSGASGGQHVRTCGTVHPSARLDWAFTASAIAMLYVKDHNGGVAEIQIDGSPVITVDMYAATTTAAERVIAAGLGSGSHVITVKYLDQSPVGGGTCIRVDAFRCGTTTDASGEAAATLTSIDLSCGSEDATVTAMTGGPSISYMITNTELVEFTASVPDGVTFTATPDQMAADGTSISNLEATVQDQFGEYVPDCTMVGFVATDENSAWITLPYELVEGEDPTEVTAGGWSTDTNGHHGGEAIYSDTQGDTASWTFTGTAVSLIYPKLSDAGVATVTVDSGSPITIDMYAPSGQYQVEHVISHCMSSGQHDIEVTVGGYTATGGTGTRVYVDAFRSGESTSGGTATAIATAGTQAGVVWAEATAVGRQCCEMDSVVMDTVPITLKAGDPHTLTITPAAVSITCCVTSTLQFTVTDEYGNIVGAVVPRTLNVDFESTPQGDFLPSDSVVVTDGVGSVIFHGYEAGSGTITGTVDGAVGTVALSVAEGDCDTLDISADREWIYVTDTHTYLLDDFVYTTTITADLKDGCENPVADGTAVTFNTSLGNLSPANPTTVNGVATTTLTSEQLGAGVPTQTAYITVTGAGCPVSDTTSVDFVRHVYTLTVTADPDEMSVGGNLSTLTADVDDGFGAPTPNGVVVTFTIAPALAAVSPADVETVGGTAAATATSETQAGVATILVTATGSTITNTGLITITAGDPQTLTIRPASVSITCCVTNTLQFTVTDEYGNIVGAVVPRTLNVDFESTPQGDFLPSDSVVVTDGVGSVIFHGYEAGSGTITGTVDGAVGTVALTVAEGDCDTLDISADRTWIYITDTHTSLLTNFPYTTTITADLEDSCDNPVADGTAVTFNTSLGDFSPASPITTVNGVATTTLTSEPLGVGVPTQTAYITVTGADCPVSATTSVDFVRHVYTMTVTAVPNEMRVGGNLSTLTADVDDGFGAPTPDGVRVVFTTTSPSRAWVLPGYVETESGEAITTATSAIQTGLVTITAVAGDTVTGTTFITITAGDPHTLTITPADISTDCCVTRTLQFTVTDEYGNLVGAVDHRPTTVCFYSIPGDLVDTWAPGGCVVVTDGVGSAEFHGWASGSGTIKGYVQYHSDVHATSNITVAASTPATLTLSRSPTSILADGLDTTLITATVKDACGNPVAGSVVTFTTDLGSFGPPPTTTLSITAPTNSSGVATATMRSECTARQVNITVTVDSVVETTYVNMVGVAWDVQLAANPASIQVGGDTSDLTATVNDQFGNAVLDGTVVTFTTSAGSVGSDTVAKPTSGGVATAVLTSPNTSGTAAITATAGAGIDAVTDTVTVTFEADLPYTVTLEAYPMTLAVGSSSALTATVVDQYNNHVADGTVVTFTTSLGELGSDSVAKTTTNGVATATLTSTLSGVAVVTATSDSRVATTTVTFQSDLPYTVTLTANPLTLTVGYSSTLTALVTDQYSNTVADGTVVTFTISLGEAASESFTRTTSSGIATATVTSSLPGTAAITATAGSASDNAAVVFQADVPYTITLEAYPTSIPVAGHTSALTATVVDQYNNNVSDGTVVTFTTSLGILGSNVAATSGGVATAVLTSETTAGTALVTATTDSKVATTTVEFTPLSPYTLTLAAYPTELTVVETSTLSATVKDQYDNHVADGTVVTFTTSLGEVGSDAVTKTTTSGVATADLTSQVPGAATITATADSVSDTVDVTFEVGPPYTVTLVAHPISLTVGATSALTATVKDQFNNHVADGTVVTFTTSLGELGSEPVTKTTVGGVATATLTSEVAGTAVVTATSDSQYGTASVTFNPDLPYTMTLEAYPTDIPIGGATSEITATVRDQYDNMVADGTEVTFTTDLGSIGSTSVVKTTANGVANATLTSGLIIGTANITATSGAAEAQTQVTFTVGPPYTVTVESWPPTIEVGGSTATITATVRDVGGYPVADDTPVVFSTDFASLGSDTVTKYTTDGVAIATLTSGTTPGIAHITATADSKSDSTMVKVAAGPPFSIDVTADPTYIPIGGATSLITATVKDRYGNNVTNGTNVDFVTDLGSVSPSSDATEEGKAGTTLTSGIIKGPATVTAIAGPEEGSVEVVFTIGPPFYVNVVADPLIIPLNGHTSNIRATVKDIGGNNVADGTEVTFSTSLGLLGSDTVVKTTTDGVAEAVLTSETAAGTAVVTATVDSLHQTTEVVFSPDPPHAVAVTADPMAIPANGVSTSAVRATVTDQYGNMVADGVTCYFHTSLGEVWPPFDTTFNGVAETTLTSSETVGLAAVTATCESIPDTIYVSFYVPEFKVYLPTLFKAY